MQPNQKYESNLQGASKNKKTLRMIYYLLQLNKNFPLKEAKLFVNNAFAFSTIKRVNNCLNNHFLIKMKKNRVFKTKKMIHEKINNQVLY